MKYQVVVSEKAKKELSKIDKTQAKMIWDWLCKKLDGCSNPHFSGKPLKGDKKGLWRYRVGRYRLLADIDDDKIIINIINVGHRQGIYNS